MSWKSFVQECLFLTWFIILSPSLAFAGTNTERRSSLDDTVYVFPFHMDNRLLVFEGEMNGIQTQFAFDTGAGLGLADESFRTDGRFSGTAGKIKIQDSNLNVEKVKIAKTRKLKIGGFEFEDIKSLVIDMPFLSCMDYYLLGADVIRQLNWEFDFEKMQVRVSKSPFPIGDDGLTFPVEFIKDRPHVKMQFSSEEFDRVLVDFGYTQILNFPLDFDDKSEFILKKESEQKANPYLGFSMGALSMATNMTYAIMIDSLVVGDQMVYGIPADFEENTTPKVGLRFFSTLSKRTVLNNSDGVFHLEKASSNVEFEIPTHLNFNYQDGKIILSGKPLGRFPQDANLEIGEEIRSLNGKTAADFGDFCGFMTWLSQYDSDEIKIIKMDGAELTFRKEPLR